MLSTNKKIHTSLSNGTKKGLKNTKYISQIILNNSIYLTNSIHLNYILSLLLPIIENLQWSDWDQKIKWEEKIWKKNTTKMERSRFIIFHPSNHFRSWSNYSWVISYTVIISSTPLCAATSASFFQVDSRCSSTSRALASLSACCLWHSSNNSASISKNIFRTLTVSPCTAWFQWLWIFFSNASKIIGNMTLRFWAIKLTICSLFHKKRARSATCNTNVPQKWSLILFW